MSSYEKDGTTVTSVSYAPGLHGSIRICNPITIRVSKLQHSSESIPFRFLANGVIGMFQLFNIERFMQQLLFSAPLCDYKVNIISHFDEEQNAAVAYFNQPYSASTLKYVFINHKTNYT